MPNNRKPRAYSDRTIKLLWGKSGGLCAFPACASDLILRSSNDIVGHIAHIVAHSSKWTRGDVDFDKSLLDEYDNLLLLCRHHHAVVDVENSSYSVGQLTQIKCDHELKMEQALQTGKPWQAKIYHLHYVNVPRLSILSSQAGIDIPEPFLGNISALHELGYALARLLVSLEKIVNIINPNAVPLSDFQDFGDDDLCKYCSFEGRFRTRNGPSIEQTRAGFSLTGILNKDPHIYQKIVGWKFIMVYDPAWVTTTTSFSDFSPTGGINKFSGLAVIKRIDSNAREVYATPLVIGIPRSSGTDLMDALSGMSIS